MGDLPGNTHEKITIGPKRKIAFVCSGGATKAGAFHLGVALALQEQGFKFYGGMQSPSSTPREPEPMEISSYVGSSAGSIISTYLAAGYSLDNIFNSFLDRKPSSLHPADLTPKVLPRLTYQKMFKLRPNVSVEQISQLTQIKRHFSKLLEGSWESILHFKWLNMTGFFSTGGIEQYLREDVLPSNRFQDYLADLYIVATQLNHSRKVIFSKYQHESVGDSTCEFQNHVGISDACAASTALPVIFSPYSIKNTRDQPIYYIDGEVRDTLSSHVAVRGGADLVIASYTHQPYHVPFESDSLTQHGLPAIIIQAIYLSIEQKINTHIFYKRCHKDTLNAVSDYCKSNGISNKHRQQICEIMEKQLHHRRDVDTLYIHPDPKDKQIFFGDHFSLSPKKMTEIVKSGFRSAIEALRKYEFADRKKKHAIGTADHPQASGTTNTPSA